jgi:diguanylate cyclase (GGDEF)-like protein/PAS domain S-box-containing protein
MVSASLEHDILEHLYDGVYVVDRQRVIRTWNPAAQRISGFTAGEAVGRRCRDNLLCHVDDRGRQLCRRGCPLAATMKDGQPREQRVYLQHREGHRVPVEVRASALRDEHGVIVGAVEIFTDNSRGERERRRLQELEKLAHVDGLTGIANRRCFDLALEERLSRLTSSGAGFGLLLIDIDHFKAVNDTHGHPMGDRVLRTVARTVALGMRLGDSVARYGGEELAVLAGGSDRGGLMELGERLRALVERSTTPAEDGGRLAVTVSLGGAVALRGDTPESLLARADGALYVCKRAGRNMCTVAEGRLPASTVPATDGASSQPAGLTAAGAPATGSPRAIAVELAHQRFAHARQRDQEQRAATGIPTWRSRGASHAVTPLLAAGSAAPAS